MKTLSNENLQVLNQRPETTIEDEVINEFRKIWIARHHTHEFAVRRIQYHTHWIKPALDKIRAVRVNREMYFDKFQVASKAYYFYRDQAYTIEQEQRRVDVLTEQDRRDLGIAQMFTKELRNLLTTPFTQFVDISEPLVIAMYKELDISHLPQNLKMLIS